MIWKRDEAAPRRAVADGMRTLHQLLFGGDLDPFWPDGPLAGGTTRERLVALLSSPLFAARVAGPALEGLPDSVLDQPLEDAARAFARRRLGVETAAAATRRDLLALMLESDDIARRLQRAGIAWSPHVLACALRDAPADASALPTAITRAQAVASGVKILDTYGLQVNSDSEELRPDLGTGGLRFRLERSSERSDYVELHVGLLGGQSHAGRLSVGYKDGAVCELDLFPRGRVRYLAAVLAAPASIRWVTWDFGDIDAPVRLRALTARPRSEAQVADALRQTAGAWALSWLAGEHLPPLYPAAPEPVAVRLSRQLSRRLGAHMEHTRPGYVDWLSEWEPTPERSFSGRRRQAKDVAASASFSVLVSFGPSQIELLLETLNSVRRQVYVRWSLHLAPSSDVPAVDLQRLASATRGGRVRLEAPSPPSPSHAERLNTMLRTCEADWVMSLAPGDVLAPQALLRFAETAARSNVSLIYADHDRRDEHGARCNPAFKPDWSPETLLACDYIKRPFVVRRDALTQADGWRENYPGAESYELLLRVSEDWTGSEIVRLPELLAHLNFPAEVQDRGGIAQAETDAVRDALRRRGVAASVEPFGTFGRHLRPLQPAPYVSLILPTRDRPELLTRSVGSILELTASAAFDLVIVDNGSEEPETLELLKRWAEHPRVRVLRDIGDFNFSRLNNRAVQLCHGEVLGLVNNDLEVISPDWLTQLAAWAMQPQIGCVGAKLLFPDDRVQHGGVLLGVGGAAAHAHKYADRDEMGYGGRLQLMHNVSAVTAACLFVRRSIYMACGGLNEALPVNYNDVDLCLKVGAAGYRNLMMAHVALYHHESASRGRDDVHLGESRTAADAAILAEAWGERLLRDHYYSPNLTQVHENLDLRWRDDEHRLQRPRARWL